MTNREILYHTAVKELTTLLHMCPDKKLVQTLLLFTYVRPISWQEDDIYAIDNLKAITLDDLFSLEDYLSDYNLILMSFDNLIEQYPNNAWAKIFRARALWAVEYYKAALEDLEAAFAMCPELLIDRMIAETEYFLQHYNRALIRICTIIEQHPDDSRSYVLRHLIYCALTEKEPQKAQSYLHGALKDLEKAATLTPRMAPKMQPLIDHLKSRVKNT